MNPLFTPTTDALRLIPVIRSTKVNPPFGVRRLPSALAVGTPIFDRLAWERGGSPLDGGGRPSVGMVVAAMTGGLR